MLLQLRLRLYSINAIITTRIQCVTHIKNAINTSINRPKNTSFSDPQKGPKNRPFWAPPERPKKGSFLTPPERHQKICIINVTLYRQSIH